MLTRSEILAETLQLFAAAHKLEEFQQERLRPLEEYLRDYSSRRDIYYGVCLDFGIDPPESFLEYANYEE